MTVAGAIILNKNKEFLLQQRDDKAPSFKNCWTLFGGLVEPGEHPEQALLRELQEELHMLPQHITSLKRAQVNLQDNDVQQIIYEAQTKAALTELTLAEGRCMEFVSTDELFKRDFAFNIREVLQRYLAHCN